MDFTILIMDDEPGILNLLSSALQREGYNVITASDGEKGVKQFQIHNPDLVVTDIKMPRKGGLEVLCEVKKINPEIDVIILTGHSDESTAIECLRQGAYDYLTKPLEDIDVFFSAIERAAFKRKQSLENRRLVRQLEEMSVKDPLTGLYNYRKLQNLLDDEIFRAQRYGKIFSVFMIDIDFFKSINDNFGHLFGDYVLKKLAELCSGIFRRTDHLCRYGGEEFFVVLPETPEKQAINPGRRLIEALQDKTFELDGQKTKITVSLGGATFPEHGKQKMDLIRSADDALYMAKKGGRNRMVFSTMN